MVSAILSKVVGNIRRGMSSSGARDGFHADLSLGQYEALVPSPIGA